MYNLPEDIRLYDLDPRSPLNEEHVCPTCGEPTKVNFEVGSLVCTNGDCEEKYYEIP